MYAKILFLALGFAFLASCGSPPSVQRFYDQHKRQAGVKNFTIPGWLIDVGTGIARPFVRDPEARRALRLARKVNKLQVMIDEDGHQVSAAEVSAFTGRARKEGFEDLIMVRDKETRVNIMVREQKDKLRHLLVLVRDDADFVFLNLKTSIRIEDIAELVNDLLQKELEEKPGEDKPALAKIPQV